MIKVSALYYYPIKSCAGWRVDTADLTPTGLRNDRQLVVTTPDGMFLTQRTHPRMALIRPTLSGNRLMLKAPGMTFATVNVARAGDVSPVTVWRDTVMAVDQGDVAAKWFSDFLGMPVRLKALSENHQRRVDFNFSRSFDDVVSFADAFASLLISQESLDQLNEKLDDPVTMERFRPNIVVTGTTPHAEDTWRELRIGDIKMTGAKPCARCAVVTNDPHTGVMGKEPNKTLATYRKFPRGVMFGMNLIHHNLGTISINDEVVIDETHAPSWVESDDYALTWQ